MHIFFALLIAFFSSGASAAYVSMSPPPGVSFVNGALSYQASAADISFANGIRAKVLGGVNVGGRAIELGAAFRYTTSAARVAAGFAFSNPALLALTAVSIAYSYYQQHDFEIEGGVWKKRVTGEVLVHGYQYGNVVSTFRSTPQLACSATGAYTHQSDAGYVLNSAIYTASDTYCTMKYTYTDPQTPWTSNPAQTIVVIRAADSWVSETHLELVTRQQFEDGMSGFSLPYGVPQQLRTPLPVEIPIINPSPVQNPEPEPKPVPIPLPYQSPQGEPQPIPDTVPQKYRSPVIQVTPSPTVGEPWRVDVVPKDIITTSPAPLEPGPVTEVPPEGQTEAQTQQDLCAAHPEILACQKPELDTPDAVEPINTDISLSISPDSGWGPSSGTCPTGSTITVQGKSFTFGFQPICDFAAMIRPLLLGFAWISAAMIFLGMGRRE